MNLITRYLTQGANWTDTIRHSVLYIWYTHLQAFRTDATLKFLADAGMIADNGGRLDVDEMWTQNSGIHIYLVAI